MNAAVVAPNAQVRQIDPIPGLRRLAAPSSLPTDLDFATARGLTNVLNNEFIESRTKENAAKVWTAYKYQGNIERAKQAAMQDPQADAPPWFVAFQNTADQRHQELLASIRAVEDCVTRIEGSLTRIEGRLTGIEGGQTEIWHCAAMAHNQHRQGSAESPLSIVPFPDGTHPVNDHNLPALKTIDDVDRLDRGTLRTYYESYGGGHGALSSDARKNFIIDAIGAKRQP